MDSSHEAWSPSPDWEPNLLSQLPGAYFFPDIINEEIQAQFEKTHRKELNFRKHGYISGTKGPSVCAVGRDYPPCLRTLIDVFKNKGIAFTERDPFQISTNKYAPGDLMVPHKDGLGNFGLITTLGSPLLLDFYYKPQTSPIFETEVYGKDEKWAGGFSDRRIEQDPNFSVLMTPGSSLLLSGNIYSNIQQIVDFC